MRRRQFLKNSSFAAIGIGVFGRVLFSNDRFIGDSPTTTDVLGPFYRPGAPFKTNINPRGFTGTNLHLTGTIFKDDGRTPFNDCLIEIWQVNHEGEYDTMSDEFNYRGAMKTGADGKYHFITTMPVPYGNPDAKRPAHIHLRIEGASGEQDLISQIYFKDDPWLKKDLYSSASSSASRTLTVSRNEKKEDVVQFDIVMHKEFPIDPAALDKFCGLYDFGNHNHGEFYKSGNLLFSKRNGQIKDAWSYKGNNEFSDGMGSTLTFTIQQDGNVKVIVNYLMDENKWQKFEGTRYLKY